MHGLPWVIWAAVTGLPEAVRALQSGKAKPLSAPSSSKSPRKLTPDKPLSTDPQQQPPLGTGIRVPALSAAPDRHGPP